MEMEFYGQRFRRVAKLRILSVYGIAASPTITNAVHLKRHMCNSSIAQPTHANSKAIHYSRQIYPPYRVIH